MLNVILTRRSRVSGNARWALGELGRSMYEGPLWRLSGGEAPNEFPQLRIGGRSPQRVPPAPPYIFLLFVIWN